MRKRIAAIMWIRNTSVYRGGVITPLCKDLNIFGVILFMWNHYGSEQLRLSEKIQETCSAHLKTLVRLVYTTCNFLRSLVQLSYAKTVNYIQGVIGPDIYYPYLAISDRAMGIAVIWPLAVKSSSVFSVLPLSFPSRAWMPPIPAERSNMRLKTR